MNTDIKMTITISDMVNYAQYQNKIPVIRNIVIENQSNEAVVKNHFSAEYAITLRVKKGMKWPLSSN